MIGLQGRCFPYRLTLDQDNSAYPSWDLRPSGWTGLPGMPVFDDMAIQTPYD